MRRIRRVSVELTRRELSLSFTSTAVSATDTHVEASVVIESAQKAPHPGPDCPLCASPWFVFATGNNQETNAVQRALGSRGIHTHQSSVSQLLVCTRTFELHVQAAEAPGIQPPQPTQVQPNISPPEKSSHDE